METNLEKGTGLEPRRTIIAEDKKKKKLKTSLEEEMQLYICKQKF